MSTKPKYDPWFRNHFVRDAICKAIYDRMAVDGSLYLIGEGGKLKVHYDAKMIERDFPDRVLTLPISEDANQGMAVGMSLAGLHVVNDIITSDFLTRAMDSIVNTTAKVNFFHYNDPKTLVIRAETLMACATAGQRFENLFPHVAGLNVVMPSNPKDAYGLMITALTNPYVSLFFEDRMLLDSQLEPLVDPVPAIPFGEANIVNSGTRLTIISYALTLQRAMSVIKQTGHDVDVIDLRTIYPVDWATILQSVKKTNKLLIIEPDIEYMGVGAEIAAHVAERLQPVLIRRLGSPRETISSSRKINENFIPSEAIIQQKIEEMI